jgi:hypothetical protein
MEFLVVSLKRRNEHYSGLFMFSYFGKHKLLNQKENIHEISKEIQEGRFIKGRSKETVGFFMAHP